jgi:gamma-glutamyltranspeptidase
VKPAHGQKIRKLIDSRAHEVSYYGGSFSKDKGTSHVSVLDTNGNAVSLTSTHNAV